MKAELLETIHETDSESQRDIAQDLLEVALQIFSELPDIQDDSWTIPPRN